MSDLFNPAWDEYLGLVETAFGLGESNPVFRAVKAARIPWRQLIEEFEQAGSGGLQLPYVVVQCEPMRPVEKGFDVSCYGMRMSTYYVRSLESLLTTVPTGATGATQGVASSTGMYVGQSLEFGDGVFGIVASVDAPTQITLEDSITTQDDDEVRTANVAADIEHLLSQFKDTLKSKTANFQAFWIEDDPVIDISDTNQANVLFQARNYPLIGGMIAPTLYVAEAY